MPVWADSLSLSDGATTPVTQTYVRDTVGQDENSWVNDTARVLGNAEILRIRRKLLSVKEGAVIVPMAQLNFQWTSRDATDPSATVFNLTMRIPVSIQANTSAARKKVKGFITGVLGGMVAADPARDNFAACRIF